jgi:hypothetical protein
MALAARHLSGIRYELITEYPKQGRNTPLLRILLKTKTSVPVLCAPGNGLVDCQ